MRRVGRTWRGGRGRLIRIQLCLTAGIVVGGKERQEQGCAGDSAGLREQRQRQDWLLEQGVWVT